MGRGFSRNFLGQRWQEHEKAQPIETTTKLGRSKQEAGLPLGRGYRESSSTGARTIRNMAPQYFMGTSSGPYNKLLDTSNVWAVPVNHGPILVRLSAMRTERQLRERGFGPTSQCRLGGEKAPNEAKVDPKSLS